MKTPLLAPCLIVGLAGIANAQSPSRPSKTTGPGSILRTATSSGGGTFLGGSDDCATPAIVGGPGSYTFDNSSATTGSEGQSEVLCDVSGTSGITNDVWFEWFATSTGEATIDTCGSTPDTRLAAYPGGGCPVDGSALACNDDSCGLQSSISFPVTSGNSYLIQLGNFPGTAGGPGILTFDTVDPDECSSPKRIDGQGGFAYDNSSATTGSEGQNETLCDFLGSSGIDNDLWFEWTADVTGSARVDTCGSGPDTKLAVYPAGGCPADGSSIACNDDGCGLQSAVTFDVIAGASYLIQAGNSPGAPGGPSTLDISITPSTNDDCATPEVLVGQGSFAYENGVATTGPEGQGETLCAFFGSTGIDNDLWFEWTAGVSGIATFDTCGSAPDTKLAIYPAGDCPAGGSALACNDDTCGLQSSIDLDVSAGTAYLIQAGNFPGSAGGPSTLNIRIDDRAGACYRRDDGQSETAAGLPGGEILWLHRYTAVGGSDVITEVASAFGSARFPGLTLPGLNAVVGIWDDPDNDGDASDAVLLYSQSIVSANESTDILNAYPVPDVPVNGVFFVGILCESPVDLPLVAPLDESEPSPGRSLIAGAFAPNTVDLSDLGAADLPPTCLGGIGLSGRWLLSATGQDCGDVVGTRYCSSIGTEISAIGSESVAANDVVLLASPVSDGEVGVFFYGSVQLSVPFSNGTRCVGGGTSGIARLPIESASGGILQHVLDNTQPPYPAVTITPGSTWNFQAAFRDPAGFGTSLGLSDGLRITFQP